MRAVVQRVSSAQVRVGGETTGQIDQGLLILLGVGQDDDEADARYVARKTAGLRIFEDDEGRMSRSLTDMGGSALVVSQFTLYGDVRKGRRPSFDRAAAPDVANRLYQTFCDFLREEGVPVETGVFRAKMDVDLVNEGPVTILIDSSKAF